MKKSNIGQSGISSIRINGQRIEDLPLGQGNEARYDLSKFLETDKENKLKNVRAQFPKHKVSFLESQIQECNTNIQRMKNFKLELKNKIVEYRQCIKDGAFRDQELAKYDKQSLKAKELRLEYPPYNIEAMDTQIEQFEDAIDKTDGVIEQEKDSIAEIREVLALVKQRDKELRNVQ